MRGEVTGADGRLEVAGEEEARLNSTPTVNSHETIAIDGSSSTPHFCTLLSDQPNLGLLYNHQSTACILRTSVCAHEREMKSRGYSHLHSYSGFVDGVRGCSRALRVLVLCCPFVVGHRCHCHGACMVK